MLALLNDILDAHGGLARWNALSRVTATIVTGGELWGIKGLIQDQNPRQMTVWLHEQRASVQPFGAPDQRTAYSPSRIAIEKTDGTLVAERQDPRDSFADHQKTTPWDGLHRAYFNGYALWTYLTTPFLLSLEGVGITEMPAWHEGPERWHRLRARFPAGLATHSTEQDFFFDSTLRLRRHDYAVDVAGSFPAAQLVHDYGEACGIRFPTKRRAYQRDQDERVIRDPLMVSIDLSEFRFS
ncbi:hypothetical protein ACVMIH_000601 [Bradyrhizobium sp. USDA 4503]